MIRIVTQAEFDAITCNRCGECCESFFLRSPLDLLVSMEAAYQWMKYWDEGGLEGKEREEQDRKQFWWYADVEPIGEPGKFDADENDTNYRCPRFARDETGMGVCTRYEERPYACSGFPYGKPSNYDSCSWNVEIVG
jgi:Fe-S-cluster containining protein